MALEYADLAPCGQICIKSMFEQAYNMNCPPYPDGRPNVECLCKDANFLNGIHDCAFATCNTPDAENTVSLAAIYCTDPKYKSPDCPCLDPLLQPGASPAIIAPAPEVNSNSDSGSGSPANNDDVSNSSDSTTSNPNSNSNTNSDDGAIPNGGNNDNTFVATPTTNGDGAVSSNDVETGEGGGLKTVTAYVAPKVSELGNTASAGASKTNELDHADASTPTSTSSGATEKNGTGAREMGNLRERVLLAVVLGFVMVL
ncbi:uncharacterized protein B0T23DRAFT_426923 [Neurospora hispaniola]|uniref:CFEM domain-containing protein n=1 Tax=Neurospora hispaniola TaxID=588809 RepID=A0AAJ0IDP5_9PEZI|nr:hypothetical protein B0T23DRAFT_426923 [Neurospora hispaniola]